MLASPCRLLHTEIIRIAAALAGEVADGGLVRAPLPCSAALPKRKHTSITQARCRSQRGTQHSPCRLPVSRSACLRQQQQQGAILQ
jgi:hypothetical protein